MRVDLQNVLLIRGKATADAAADIHRVGHALDKIGPENLVKIS